MSNGEVDKVSEAKGGLSFDVVLDDAAKKSKKELSK